MQSALKSQVNHHAAVTLAATAHSASAATGPVRISDELLALIGGGKAAPTPTTAPTLPVHRW